MKTVNRFFKTNFFMIVFACFLVLPASTAFSSDNLVKTLSQFYTGYYTSFNQMSGNNIFSDSSGNLHAAIVDNYELYYLSSIDSGSTWTSEKITTGHEGDIKVASLVVDNNGKIFIGFSCNDGYNYGDASTVSYGNEFNFDLYCANNLSGSWSIETVNIPTRSGSDNYGPLSSSMIVDANNDVHLFANRYGWWSYGGTAWDFVRSSASSTWGSAVTLAEFTDKSVDRILYGHYRSLIDSSGNITLIMIRPGSTYGVDDTLFYVKKLSGSSSWSSPVDIASMNRSVANHLNFDAAIDSSGNIHVVYVNETSGAPQILYLKNFGSSSSIYTGDSDETIFEIKLHSTSSGALTLLVNPLDGKTGIITGSSSGTWSTLSTLTVTAPDGMASYIDIVRSNTYGGKFTEFAMMYWDREATDQVSPGPYGPDKIYYSSGTATNNPTTDTSVIGAQVAAGNTHTIGLKTDGTVVGVGNNSDGETNVSSWSNIKQVAAGHHNTVGLKTDGTVILTGDNAEGHVFLGHWTDIQQVSTGYQHVVGVKSDGTVVDARGDSVNVDASSWTHIKQVAVGMTHVAGLKTDGTVVALGDGSSSDGINVSSWTGIQQIDVDYHVTVGLKNDGTVVAVGNNSYGQLDVSSWSGIKQVGAGELHTVGLKSDGTVIAIGSNGNEQCNVSSWTDIVQISVGMYHTVGLKQDGTVVATGGGSYGEGDVSSWNLGASTTTPTHLTQTQVSQLYVSIFGRASEGEGNTYWQTNQTDMVAAADTMLATGAAGTYFGATLNNNQLFIEYVYENTLGKTYSEDPDGVNYWVSELSGKSKGEVIVTLISAVMDTQYTGVPAQDQFINKVAVCNYTADTISTAPDVNDLTAFVDFIVSVTDDSTTVTTAKTAVNAF